MGYYTDLLADRSLEYLEARAEEPDKPWLLSLHFTAAHWPWEADNDEGPRGIRAARRSQQGANERRRRRRTQHRRLRRRRHGNLCRHGDSHGPQRRPRARPPARAGDGRGHRRRLHQRQRRRTLQPQLAVQRHQDRAARRRPARAVHRPLAGPRRAGQPRATCRSCRWTSCRPSWPRPAARPTRPIRRTVSTFTPRWRAAPCPSARSTGASGTRTRRPRGAGRYKYLSINGNEYLFDIVADPQERANLAKRMPAKFAELKGSFDSWNEGMIPYDKSVSSFGFDAEGTGRSLTAGTIEGGSRAAAESS